MILVLKNNVSKQEFVITGLTDLNTSVFYWSFDVVLPEGVIDGDYNYTLSDDNNVLLSSGLARIGDYTPSVTANTASTGSYIVYR